MGTGVDDDVKQRLLAAADRAASANEGEAERVEVVRTTRGNAADLTGHGTVGQNQEVWVIQVSGTDYSCRDCGGMPGAIPVARPPMRYITLVMTASDYAGTDFGMSPNPTDLSRYGAVEVLRG